jgi:hypothetical protein
VLWIHSDRQKILYGVDKTGKLLGQWDVVAASGRFFIYNWEDISIESRDSGPDRIWIADIGNNYVRGGGDPRTSVNLMSIDEPSVDFDAMTTGTVRVIDNLQVTYPDALHDAEGMAADPLTGDLYIFAKEEASPSKVFRIKAPPAAGELEYVASIDSSNLNGADFSPSGRELLVRNYSLVMHWTLAPGQTWAEALASAPDKQMRLKFTENYYAEAIAFSADESGFYVVSEQDEGAPPSPVEFYARSCP